MSNNRLVRTTKKFIYTLIILAALAVMMVSASVSWLVGNYVN